MGANSQVDTSEILAATALPPRLRQAGDKRIEKGIAVLDEKVPGWFKKIDPETLDLRSLGSCVLGQVFGDYGIGMTRLFPETVLVTPDIDTLGVEHGFDRPNGIGYSALTQMWVDRLETYRALVEQGG